MYLCVCPLVWDLWGWEREREGGRERESNREREREREGVCVFHLRKWENMTAAMVSCQKTRMEATPVCVCVCVEREGESMWKSLQLCNCI